MKSNMITVTSRSASYELQNGSCYYAERPYEVFLNGVKLGEERKNNIGSLFGLKPGTEYEIEIRDGATGVSHRESFMTEIEPVRLDIRRFGAVGDGEHDDTRSIQAAIMAVPQGGTVLIPPGDFRTGPLFLKSHMTLELAAGSHLLGHTDRSMYPVLPGSVMSDDWKSEYFVASWEGNPQDSFASLITGIGVENVRVIGEGILDGDAHKGDWWVNHREKRISWRPKMVFLAHCRDITFQGITIKNSPSWTCHPYFSEGITFVDVRIDSPDDSPNTDGFDPESCSDLKVLGVHISVGDDCVAIKSGALYMGRRFKRPTENALFRNCLMEAGHGGIVLGSEMSGGIRNIMVSQCYFKGTDRGLRIKTRRGRGKDAVIDGITFENIRMEDVKAPLVINMFYHCGPDGRTPYVWSEEPAPVDDRTPYLGKFTFRDMRCTGCETAAGYFVGLPEQPIEEIVIDNVSFDYKEKTTPFVPAMMTNIEPQEKVGIFASDVRTLVLKNISLQGHKGDDVVAKRVSIVDRNAAASV